MNLSIKLLIFLGFTIFLSFLTSNIRLINQAHASGPYDTDWCDYKDTLFGITTKNVKYYCIDPNTVQAHDSLALAWATDTNSCPAKYPKCIAVTDCQDSPLSLSNKTYSNTGARCVPADICSNRNNNSCEGGDGQCFWYAGGQGQGGRCVDNNGDMGVQCPSSEQGHCYIAGPDGRTQNCQPGNYCSADAPSAPPQSPPSSPPSSVQCAKHDTAVGCELDRTQNGCYWINNICKSEGELLCKEIIDPNTCQSRSGCNWIGNICKSESELLCSDNKNPNACQSRSGCNWIGNVCKSESELLCSDNKNPNACNILTKCTWNSSGICVPKSSPTAGRNSCEGDDNKDGAFSCMSSCASPYSTSTTNTGYYSCGNKGGLCCKNDAIYKTRGGLGTPSKSPSTGGNSTPSNTPTSPTATPRPNRAEALACEFHGGRKDYIGSFCGSADGATHSPFDPAKAANKDFCTMTYIDAYKCNDGTDDYFPVAENTTCAQAPWCQSAKPNAPADAPSCVGQGVGCGATGGGYTCCSSQNLECVKFGSTPQFVCQYKAGGAPTATPGAPSQTTCEQQIANGRGSIGCACPDGGGCLSGGCYPAAGGSQNDNKTWYCSQGGVWCEKSKTTVPNASSCPLTSPYSAPTAAPRDLSYQADCPNNGTNACVLGNACPAGYSQHPSEGSPGGTNGNQVCTEFESAAAACCTKNAGTTSPVITSPPTPTPTPLTSSSHPTGPWINFNANETCPVALSGYWKGTYCDADGTYYDEYCTSGKPERKATGNTCIH